MRSTTLLFLGLLFIIGCEVQAQPKIVIEGGDSVNWGRVKYVQEPLNAKVKIWNKGKIDSLKIYSVKPGCGCTTAPLDKEMIEPGGYATMDIKLKAPENDGILHKTITMRTSDPDNRTKILHLVADIEMPLTIRPKYFHFGTSDVNKPDTALVVLINNSNKKMTIKEILLEPKELKLNIDKGAVIPPNGGQLSVRAYYTPKALGRFAGRVKMKTDHPDATKIDLSVGGNVVDVKNNPHGIIIE